MLPPKLKSVTPLPLYRLRLEYETGEIKSFDAAPYIEAPQYGELRNILYFKTVRLLADHTGIEWRNGQCIAPRELYEQSVEIRTKN